MAIRTIQSPGVEIRERDLSLRVPTPAGTTVYITGYADQGPSDEVISISSIGEFEQIYGAPRTPAERYFYHSVKAALNSTATLLVNRIPYGPGSGEGFGSLYSVLGYPVSAVGSTTLDTVSGTYLLGSPTQFNITEQQYLDLVDGTLFSTWGTTPATSFNALNTLSGAGLIVINKAQTVIDGKYQGYYLGLADNTNINPASAYDAIRSVNSVSVSAASTGLTAFTPVPSTRFDFAVSATPAFGSNPARNSISQVMEESIPNYDIGDRNFDDTLNVGVFKLKQSVFANDATTLAYALEEGYNGSIGYFRQVNNENGGAPVNFFLENVENDSRNISILVNPYVSDYFRGITLNPDGNPSKKIRVISKQVENLLTTTPAASSYVGCTLAQLTGAANVIGYADQLFPIGAYGETKIQTKLIGNLPDKIDRALESIRNDEVYNIDVIAEAGLGTIWTSVCASSALGGYFDDTKTGPAIDALRTTSDLTNTAARDFYTTIFNKFATFCGPIKDGGRGDAIFVADPIRQILVAGKDRKVIEMPSTNFSRDIYWALRHQFSNANTSYAAVYPNYIKSYDETSGLYIYNPSSGYVAAKMASTDSDLGPWVAPAGFNRGVLTDAIDIAFAPNQRQRDELYRINMNPITRYPDQGIVIVGQKTLLKKPSAFDRINVRRNFLYLEKITKSVMKFFLFENNTLFTRTRVTNTLVPFFENVKTSQGLYDYLIVCDERNNTPEVIDNNELVVDIYLKPVKSAEFILVNFYATRTDTNFQELVGG